MGFILLEGLILDEKSNVVYLHKDKEGVVKYVGSGTIQRAYRTDAKSSKGERYVEYVKNNGKLEVEIVAEGLNKLEAEDLERELYDKYKESVLNARRPSSTKILTKEMFEQYLYYDESSETGLRWKINGLGKGGGNIRKDKPAGSLKRGYYITGLNSKEFRNHRIIAVLHGLDVNGKVIDHIDRNTLNNNISNLRPVSQQENLYNRGMQQNNSSGTTGVSWHKSGACWVVQWKVKKKNCVKYFRPRDYPSSEEAFKAAVEYRKLMVELHYQ